MKISDTITFDEYDCIVFDMKEDKTLIITEEIIENRAMWMKI